MFTITGQVQRRSGRGRALGIPTININLTPITSVQDGVYAGYVQIKKQRYKAAIFIGTPELFQEQQRQLEAHLLDFNGDLYGEIVTVEGIYYLRAYQRFNTVVALVEQIKQDIEHTRICLAALSKS